MIRPTHPSDTPALLELARGTNVFRPAELDTLREVLDDYHDHEAAAGHHARTLLDADRPIGFVYFAPSSMSERGWYLWWIVVDAQRQGRGLGSLLLDRAEEEMRHARARLALIETSSLPRYEPTRRFYLRHGYEIASVLRDFYADGDDLVVFAKRLGPGSEMDP